MEMPKTWKEKLDCLQIGEFEPVTDETEQGAYSSIRRDFKGTGKQFSIRTDPNTKQKAAWRTS